MLRLSFLLLILHLPLLLHLHSQCDLKLDSVSWGSEKVDPRDFKLSSPMEYGSDILSPINESQNNIEFRIIRLIPGKNNWLNSCIRFYCNRGKGWQAEQFVSTPAANQDSVFSTHAKIKWEQVANFERKATRYLKYQITLPDDKEEFWMNFWRTFKEHEFLSIKKEDEIYEQLLSNAIREFGAIDSIPLEHRVNAVPLHGINFRLELKYFDNFKRLDYYAADFYADIYPDVPEFQKILKLFELIDATLGFLKHR